MACSARFLLTETPGYFVLRPHAIQTKFRVLLKQARAESHDPIYDMMTYSEVLNFFYQCRKSGDYTQAALVTRPWVTAHGQRHEMWLVNMGLLLWALTLGRYEEAWKSVAALQEIDARDPGLLSLIASMEYSRGHLTKAVENARLAFEYASADDDPVTESYAEDLRLLAQGRPPYYVPRFME